MYSSILPLEDVLVYVVGGFVGLLIAAPFCRISEYLQEKKERGRRTGRREKSRRYNGRDDRYYDERYDDEDYDNDYE